MLVSECMMNECFDCHSFETSRIGQMVISKFLYLFIYCHFIVPLSCRVQKRKKQNYSVEVRFNSVSFFILIGNE